MKYSVVLCALLLSGCSTFIPVKRNFPEAPAALKIQCEALKQVEGDHVAITELLKIVVQNYTLYYECSTRVEGWNDWYTEQKKIFEKVK